MKDVNNMNNINLKDMFEDNIKVPENLDEYILKGLDQGIAIKNNMNPRHKKPYIKIATVAALVSVTLIGSMALTQENTWASINNLVSQIESFLGRNDHEFDKYKFEGNQSIKHNGLVLNLGDVMLDDNKLVISVSMDYSNFDFDKYNIDKKNLAPDIPLITIGNLSFPSQGGQIQTRDLDSQNKKEFLYTVDLTEMDTDNDDVGDTPVNVLDKLKKNKDYNLQIYFKDFHTGESKTSKGLLLRKNLGDFEFDTTINNSTISKDLKVVDLNKVVKAGSGSKMIKYTIKQVRITPASVNITTSIKGSTLNDISAINLKVTDEKGNYLEGGAIGNCNGDGEICNFELKGTEKKIIITPSIDISSNNKTFDKIEIPVK